MEREGPLLEALTRRLAECPPDFLAPPLREGNGVVHVGAVAADLLRAMGTPLPEASILAAIAPPGATPNRLRLVAVTSWLLYDGWFLGQPDLWAQVPSLLAERLGALAALVSAESCVTDPDRREELVRACLAHLGLRPRGESAAQATDRLTTLDSVERDRITRKTRDAEGRARLVREMMAKRAAEEAAAKVSRE